MLLLISSETGHLYTFATGKFRPILDKAKQWFDANVNADHPAEPDFSTLALVQPAAHDDDIDVHHPPPRKSKRVRRPTRPMR
jgi:hypothetical protein